MGKGPRGPQAETVANSSSARPRPRPGAAALAHIFAPATSAARDGFRHVNVGRSGSGKTWLTRRIVDAALHDGLCQWALILDDKHADLTPYEGHKYSTADGFRSRPPAAGEDRRAIFRGDHYAGVTCSAESVAQLAQQLARARQRPLLVLDEGKRATTDAGRAWTAPTAKWSLTEGRAVGLSMVISGQDAASLPRECANECSSVAIFQVKALAAPYVAELFRLSPALEQLLPHLEVGEFLLLADSSDEWAVYQFEERR